MSYTDKHIVETFTDLFEGLSYTSKIKLIESLSKSLKNEKTRKDTIFFKSFGAFCSEKSAKEIINEIKSSRTFKPKEIKLS